MFNVATKTVRDNWAAYLANRKYIEQVAIEDVIEECVEVQDQSKLPKKLTDNAKAYWHCNVKSHFFIVKENEDERVFIGMMPFSTNRAKPESEWAGKRIPLVQEFPDDIADRIAVYGEWMNDLDLWLGANRDDPDRDRALSIKERCVKEMKSCRMMLDPKKRFTNDAGKIQYDKAITYLLAKVDELETKILNLELQPC